MASSKVLVKCTNNKLCTKQNLLLVLNGYSVKVIKVVPSGKDFNIFCDGIVECEKMYDDRILSSLSASGFSPVLPAELKSSRSVIVRRVDNNIFDNSVQNIKAEIVKCNEWCGVDEVIKLRKTLKIVFSSSSVAEKSLTSGLSMFFLHVPGYNIIRDRFIRIDLCYVCYAVDDHLSINCPIRASDRSYLICSKCSERDHDHKSCSYQRNI